MTIERIQPGVVASIAYTLTIDGIIEQFVDAGDPVEYLHGADNLIPGLEAALVGRQVGDEFKVTVAPIDGYGERDEELVVAFPIDDLETTEGMEPGVVVELIDDEDDIIEATVVELRDNEVILDLNPELAGKTLHYIVEVVEIREATEQEKELGLPASIIDELMANLEQFSLDD